MVGAFVRVQCPDCESEATVFEKASTTAACAVCGHTLATPTGGLADIDAEVLETIER